MSKTRTSGSVVNGSLVDELESATGVPTPLVDQPRIARAVR